MLVLDGVGDLGVLGWHVMHKDFCVQLCLLALCCMAHLHDEGLAWVSRLRLMTYVWQISIRAVAAQQQILNKHHGCGAHWRYYHFCMLVLGKGNSACCTVKSWSGTKKYLVGHAWGLWETEHTAWIVGVLITWS
jgi:hypothetical protein